VEYQKVQLKLLHAFFSSKLLLLAASGQADPAATNQEQQLIHRRQVTDVMGPALPRDIHLSALPIQIFHPPYRLIYHSIRASSSSSFQ
jgi:hypothetical protein